MIEWRWGLKCVNVERDSSAAERRYRKREREPGFESPFVTVAKFGNFRSLHDASVDSAVNEYLAIDSGGHVSE